MRGWQFLLVVVLVVFTSSCSDTGNERNIIDHAHLCSVSGDESGSGYYCVRGTGHVPVPAWTCCDADQSLALFYMNHVPCTSDGVVYITKESALSAIDIRAGKKEWTRALPDFAPQYLTVCDSKIIAIGLCSVPDSRNPAYDRYASKFIVVDSATGKIDWSTKLIGSMGTTCGNEPVVISNKVYLPAMDGSERLANCTSDGELPARRENRGIHIWDMNTGKHLGVIRFSFLEGEMDPGLTKIVSDGKLLFIFANVVPSIERNSSTLPGTLGCGARYLLCYDPLIGKTLWKRKVSSVSSFGQGANSLAIDDGLVAIAGTQIIADAGKYTASPSLCIHVFSKCDGKLLWSKSIHSIPIETNMALAKGTLLISDYNSGATCFSAVDGREQWHSAYSSNNLSMTQICPVSNLVYVYTRHGYFDTDDTENIRAISYGGRELWTLEIPHGMSAITPVNDGFLARIFVGKRSAYAELATRFYTVKKPK